MSTLFAGGAVVDVILLAMILEGTFLLWYRRRTSRGPSAPDLLATLGAGACLMLALRGALVGADWRWIALALAASLVAHLADIGRRWRRGAA